MLSGSLLDKICLFALPLAASSILQQLFNAADIAVVGRFASSRALAAVGSTSSSINLLINLFVGLSVGANVVIAQFIGQHKMQKVAQAVHTVISVALLSGVFLLALGQFAARPLLTLMRTPPDVIGLSVRYLRVYFLGMPFVMLYNFGAAILRSKGDSKRPLYCLTVAGVVNVLLNLLLVIVFRMSVAGVAIATVVSNMVSATLILSFLAREDAPFRLNLRRLALQKEYVLGIVRIGAPAGLQGMVFSFSNVCIQSAINAFGADAIAGGAAANTFEMFAFFPIKCVHAGMRHLHKPELRRAPVRPLPQGVQNQPAVRHPREHGDGRPVPAVPPAAALALFDGRERPFLRACPDAPRPSLRLDYVRL